jgi:hypothetical protein
VSRKPVVAYEGRYEVSDQGQVFSLFFGRELKQYKLNPEARYAVVWLTTATGKGKAFPVHHLVLEAFVGPRPEGMIACHGQGGSKDNSLQNLSWGTYKQNNGPDRERDGTALHGSSHPSAKLTESDVREIRLGTLSLAQAAKKFHVSETVICNARNYKTWKHVQ